MSKTAQDILKKLSEEMPFRWRVGQVSKDKKKCTVLAYVDARDVMDKLDEVVGPQNWTKEYKEVKGNLYCGIGIKFPDSEEFIWKWDCGSETQVEEQKGEASDAFKRAAVNFGVGRFLYGMDSPWFPYSEEKKGMVKENGEKVWKVSAHVNEFMAKKKGNKKAEPAATKPEKKEVKPVDDGETEESEQDTEALDKEIKKLNDQWKKIMAVEQEALKVYTTENLDTIRAKVKDYYEKGERDKVITTLTKSIEHYNKKIAAAKK